jgi:hypothetical protein
MKRSILAALVFVLLSPPCFAVQSASISTLDGTAWYILPSFSYGADSLLGFYRGDVYVCDSESCSPLVGSTYTTTTYTWDSYGCIVNGWLTITGATMPFFSIGTIQSCNSSGCENGFIFKISDSFKLENVY